MCERAGAASVINLWSTTARSWFLFARLLLLRYEHAELKWSKYIQTNGCRLKNQSTMHGFCCNIYLFVCCFLSPVGQTHTSMHALLQTNTHNLTSRNHERILYKAQLMFAKTKSKRLFNDYPTCSKRHWRLEHVG